MSSSGVVYKFGEFELRRRTRELYRSGIRLKLRPQALSILELLAERAGDLVTRVELQEKLWTGKDFGDFEQGLNNTVRELRGALSDSAAAPRYIETLPKMGYRLMVPVEVLNNEATRATVAPNVPSATDAPLRKPPAEEKLPPQEKPRTSSRWAAIATMMALLALAGSGYLVWTWTRARGKTVRETQRTVVAVLPFTNLTGDASQEYFSDGLTEEMIGQLGRLDPQRLGVIARTSVMQFKQNGESLGKVGSELGAQYVMEGSVRRDADKVRISAQLIQTKDQTRIWSREYDRELSNLLALQSEIAREITGEILLTIKNQKNGATIREAPLSPKSYEAYDLYLKGLYFWNKRNPEGFEKAVSYFQQAVDKDPSDARAYAGLADSYALMSGYAGVPPATEFLEKARAASRRAVELDDSLAEAHTARAVVAQNLEWDWKTAAKEYRRAIALEPNYATAHHWFAEYLALMGRFDEASLEMEQARVLDPLSLVIATDHGVILYYARRYDQAIEQFRTVLEMDPSNGRAGTIDLAYLEKGMLPEAQARLDQQRILFSQNSWQVGLSIYVDARSGRTEEARRSLERLQKMNKEHHMDPLILTLAYLGLKNKDQALSCLEKAYAEHSVSLTALNVDPVYDFIREEPRFRKVLRQMELTP